MTRAHIVTFALALASVPSLALGQVTRVERGPILGTTPFAIDIEVGSGISREDRRFDFAPAPHIVRLERRSIDALAHGTALDVVVDRSTQSRVRTVVLDASRAGGGFPDTWHDPHGDTIVVRCRLSALRLDRRAAYADVVASGRVRRFAASRGTTVVAVAAGERRDLVAGRPAIVVATERENDLHGVAQTIVVASDGPMPQL